jgi:ubiquinone/menaquinone biosynthesis C-methylase UbiE
MRTHEQAVHEQFDPQAAAYLTSKVHAAGADLAAAVARVGGMTPAPQAALDVGCGAGHLSFALGSLVRRVTAYDPSQAMLATVRAAAAERGLTSIETVQGRAEQLPFPDACFDLACTRYSAHHWLDVPAALTEMRRVLTPGGWLLVIDLLAEEQPLVDTWLQCLELMRDPSHVRDRSVSEWSELIARAGFQPVEQETFPIRLQFGPWVQRIRTPPELVTAIRALQERAPTEVRAALELEADGSFTARTGLFLARPA